MSFKLIMAIVDHHRTGQLLKAAREAGATGSTVITGVRGQGRNPAIGILGLEITDARDVLLFVVDEQRARTLLERLAEVGEFDDTPGTGIALQIDVADAIGVRDQARQMSDDAETPADPLER